MKQFALAVLLFAALVPSAFSGTYYVGKCHIHSYNSISAAVNDPTVAAGSVIYICPGQYQEQIIITKPLTLQGMSQSNAAGALITDPLGLQSTTSAITGSALVPRIWVQASPVNLVNLKIIPQFSNLGYDVGILYSSDATGAMNHVAVSAVQNPSTPAGIGVWIENADTNTGDSVNITSSVFEANLAPLVAISVPYPVGFAPYLSVNISSTQIHAADGAPAVQLARLGGTISGNTILNSPGAGAPGNGIVDNAPDLLITGNTILFSNIGIQMQTPGANLTSNKITTFGVGIDFGCYANTVTGNTITGANPALNNVPATFSGKNTFVNTFRDIGNKC
jgi:hypothetical protein